MNLKEMKILINIINKGKIKIITNHLMIKENINMNLTIISDKGQDQDHYKKKKKKIKYRKRRILYKIFK